MRRLISTLMLAALGACSPVEIPKRSMPNVQIPKAYASPGGEVPAPVQWWRAYEDPQLNQHVDLALQANLDLRQSWARLAQAAAQARIIGAPLAPEVNLTSQAARTRSDGGSTGTQYASSWVLGFGLSWEIDLWRRIANRADAASLLAAATRQDVEQTALILTGTVTDTWFTIEAQSRLLAVIREQIRLSEKLLDIIEYRYANGLADALQVYQQRLQLESVSAQIPPAQSQLETAINALMVLQGKPPESFVPVPIRASLPALPPLPILGSPAELVERRPDLKAARDRLEAADREVAAAVADMLPAISFSLGYDFRSSSFSDPFNSGLASIGGSLLQPLFDNDRRGAEVVRRRAIVLERMDAFSQAYLIALREIEDALDQERHQIELLEDISVQLELAGRQLEAAQRSYGDGVAEYLDVISAVQTQQSLQREQVSAHRLLLTYRANLYRALGGSWMHDMPPPSDIAELESQVGHSVTEENET